MDNYAILLGNDKRKNKIFISKTAQLVNQQKKELNLVFMKITCPGCICHVWEANGEPECGGMPGPGTANGEEAEGGSMLGRAPAKGGTGCAILADAVAGGLPNGERILGGCKAEGAIICGAPPDGNCGAVPVGGTLGLPCSDPDPNVGGPLLVRLAVLEGGKAGPDIRGAGRGPCPEGGIAPGGGGTADPAIGGTAPGGGGLEAKAGGG